MTMVPELWNTYIIAPLLNVLIYLYDTIGMNNLGLAVVEFTFLVRVLLLPLSIVVEGNKNKYDSLKKDLSDLHRDYNQDVVTLKEARRQLFNKHQISPWANFLLLAWQAFVLVALYQVFVNGFYVAPGVLYPWVTDPGVINKSFLGLFDISKRNAIVAILTSLFVLLGIHNSFKNRQVSRSDKLFRNYFPVMVFFILWSLPSVKSVFILTSIAASRFIHFLNIQFYSSKNEEPVAVSEVVEEKVVDRYSNPLDRLRQ